MTAGHFEDTITTLIERIPFQIFKVELNTGEQVEIDHSRAIIVRDGRAVFLGPGGTLHLFDHESVNQVIVEPVGANV
jgi:hypothetical protein